MLSTYYEYLPEYSDTMHLRGYTPEQIMEAAHRTMLEKWCYKGNQAATDKAVEAQLEKQLDKAISKALDDLFKDWK